MSNEAVAVDVTPAESPTVILNDEQVDKYFESGGTADIENIQESTPEKVETDAKSASDEKEVNAENEPQKEDKTETKEKYVPYGALHEERQRRKELQAKVERMEHTFQNVVQKIAQPEQKAPSFDEDPLNALKYNQEQQEKYLREQNQYLQQQYETQRAEQIKRQFVNAYGNQSLEYLNTNPEYKDAYNFLIEQRNKEFIAMGYDANTAKQLIENEELEIAANAMKQNINPAERMHKLAKLRGFKSSENKAQNNPAQKLEQVQKGMNTSKSLSNVSGKAQSSFTLEALAEMDDDEFSKNWTKAMKLG